MAYKYLLIIALAVAFGVVEASARPLLVTSAELAGETAGRFVGILLGGFLLSSLLRGRWMLSRIDRALVGAALSIGVASQDYWREAVQPLIKNPVTRTRLVDGCVQTCQAEPAKCRTFCECMMEAMFSGMSQAEFTRRFQDNLSNNEALIRLRETAAQTCANGGSGARPSAVERQLRDIR